MMQPAFNPQLITDPRWNPLAGVAEPEPVQTAPTSIQNMEPTPPQQVFVPVPIKVHVPAPTKALNVSPDSARKAQGIYPAEQQAKQAQINNAKAMPAPTGAWGSPA